MHHQARRDVEEIGAALGLQCDHGRDLEARRAKAQLRADRRLERRHQALLDPDRAARRARRSRGIRRIRRRRNAQTPDEDSP